MGFDINISMELYMCPEKGKPFYFKKKDGKFEKIYDFPDILVPGKMCDYIEG